MRTRHRRQDEHGAVAVEFALLVPVIMVLIFGMVDFGFAVNRYASLSNAAREGVRMASLGGTATEVRNAVQASLADIGASGAVVDVSCLTPTGGTCPTFAAAEMGGTAIVRIDFTGPWLTPVGSSFSPTMQLSKTSRMRIE